MKNIEVENLPRPASKVMTDHDSGKSGVLVNAEVGGVYVFGDGSDSDVTIAADTTLTRDMFYNSLTVNATKVLTAAGYRIHVKGNLVNNGYIRRNGNNGATVTAGTALSAGSLGGSGAGGAGGDIGVSGQGGGGGSGGGILYVAAKILNNVSGVISANGGAGGNAVNSYGDQSQAGGAEGSATAPAASVGGFRAAPYVSLLHTPSGTVLSGGAGGGGGAAHATPGNAGTGTTNSLGASGGAGGSQVSGGTGGGGGGGGGFVALFYKSLTLGTVTATGGTGGTGVSPGQNGAVGTAGTVAKYKVA